jgi:outer membrane protein OmpA-like peptidoglycan-associated protein
MQTLKWVTPLMLAASFSVQAGENSNNYNPQQQTRMSMNNGFGFSMGFNGNSSSRNNLSDNRIILHGVNFEYDSAVLTPESNKVLDEVATQLRTAPELIVEVRGHASAEGEVAYNMDLSVRRASAVCDYLVQQGVKAKNMRAMGYGEWQPVTSNEVEQGRSMNRRVELRRL